MPKIIDSAFLMKRGQKEEIKPLFLTSPMKLLFGHCFNRSFGPIIDWIPISSLLNTIDDFTGKSKTYKVINHLFKNI